MSRHPAISTTLEEDLKILGLLSEEGPETDAPSGEPARNKASKSRNVGAMSDDPSDEGEDESDEAEGLPHEGDTQLSPDKAPTPVPMKGGQKESKVSPQGASAVTEALNRIRSGRTQEEAKSSLSTAEELIESAKSILDEISDSQRAESVKAFANVSVIAEMLSKGFAGFANKYEDEALSEAAEALDFLSSEASEIAQVLDGSEEVDDEKVDSYFQTQMEALIDSLDLYSDVVEADEHLESETVAEGDEGDDEDDDGEEDDDDDKDDKKSKKDDEDPEEKEESVRFKTPLIKKGGKSTGTMSPSTGARAALTMGKSEAYMPYGSGKGPMVSKPGKAKSVAAKESKK